MAPLTDFLHDNFGPATIGIDEKQVRRGSGLRCTKLVLECPIDPNFISSTGEAESPAPGDPMGRTMAPTSGNWTEFPVFSGLLSEVTGVPPSMKPPPFTALNYTPQVENRWLPCPSTPYFQVTQRNAVDVVPDNRFKLRVTGRDQYGSGIVEVTPWMVLRDIAGTNTETTHHGWLSKVFSVVEKVEYQYEELTPGNTMVRFRIGVGMRPDFGKNGIPAGEDIISTATAGDIGTYYNQGFASPLHIRPFVKGPLGGTGQGRLEIVGGFIENLTKSTFAKLPPAALGDYNPFGSRVLAPGGWLTGSSDSGDSWQGCSDKIGILMARDPAGPANSPPTWLPALPTTPDIALASSPETGIDWGWDDRWRMHVWVASTVGAGQIDADYPVINLP